MELSQNFVPVTCITYSVYIHCIIMFVKIISMHLPCTKIFLRRKNELRYIVAIEAIASKVLIPQNSDIALEVADIAQEMMNIYSS